MGKHNLGLLPESSRSLSVATFLRLDKLLGLGEAATDETNTDGKASGDPEDSLPGFDCTSDAKIGASGEHITHGVTLLQDTRHEAASISRAILKSHCNSIAVSVEKLALNENGQMQDDIHSAHKEAEQTANSQKLVECFGIDGCNL